MVAGTSVQSSAGGTINLSNLKGIKIALPSGATAVQGSQVVLAGAGGLAQKVQVPQVQRVIVPAGAKTVAQGGQQVRRKCTRILQ